MVSDYFHIVESQQFDEKFLDSIFKTANDVQKNLARYADYLKGSLGLLLFYESSTRTRLSFESAILRLGGKFIHTENARDFSSAIKGETLEDSIRVVSNYADYLILRHFDDESSQIAARYCKIPVINAGSGKSQHPTQCLADVYTIYKYFSRLDSLKIMVVGDLANGRTCASLIYLLSKFSHNSFCFVSPDNCKIKPGLLEHLKKKPVSWLESSSLEDSLPNFSPDVVYVTRIQKERFSNYADYLSAKGKIVLTQQHLKFLKSESIIMHPLPRVDEIDFAIDSSLKAKYFEQTKNGLLVRMALLKIMQDYLNN